MVFVLPSRTQVKVSRQHQPRKGCQGQTRGKVQPRGDLRLPGQHFPGREVGLPDVLGLGVWVEESCKAGPAHDSTATPEPKRLCSQE